jgi:hypothetical protein
MSKTPAIIPIASEAPVIAVLNRRMTPSARIAAQNAQRPMQKR